MPIARPKPVEKQLGRQRLVTTTLCESEALEQFARSPDRFLELYGGETIKHDATSTVSVSSLNGQKVVIKRFNSRNFLHPFKRALRQSRAQHCFNNALYLQSLGIATPAPIAAVEQRLGPMRGSAWFIANYVEGENLLDWMREHESLDAEHTVVKQLLGFFDKMQSHRFAHGDMKATNLLVAKTRLYVLDLDGMRRYQSVVVHQDRLARDGRRFMKNWREQAHLTALFKSPLQAILDAEPPLSQWLRQRFR